MTLGALIAAGAGVLAGFAPTSRVPGLPSDDGFR